MSDHSYTEGSYGEDVMTLEGAAWYKVVDLGAAVSMCKTINFSVVTQREQARERLSDLRNVCPYSMTVRFPAGVTYICDAKGDWPRKFTQVLEALCFKETTDNPGAAASGRTNMLKKMTGPNDGPVTPVEWDYNMAERAYFTGLEQMSTQIGRNDSIFGRKSFEAMYGLDWE